MKKIVLLLLLCISIFPSYAQDTLAVFDHYCESSDPLDIDTTTFEFIEDSLVVRNIRNQFCCPAELIAKKSFIGDTIKIEVVIPGDGPDCLCECSFGYTFKIPDISSDTVLLKINGEFLKAINKTTGLKNKIRHELKIYPNPASTTVFIEGAIEKMDTYELYDSQGILILSSVLNSDMLTLPAISPGIYNLVIKGRNGAISQKIYIK